MSSEEQGQPIISRPRPLVKRSKSMSTTGRKSSVSAASSSRPDSKASATSHFSSSGRSMMQSIIKVLNTPIVDSSNPSPRSSISGRSGSTRFRRAEKQAADEESRPPIPRLRSVSSLRVTTMSLLSDYSAFRQSIISSEAERPTEDILAAAKKYYTSMKAYLILIDDLPPAVRDTLEVKRLRQQLEFTVELLEPVMQEAHSTQTILLLDNTLMLVKNILSDVQYLLLQQNYPPASVPEEDEQDEQDDDTSSTDAVYDFDIPEAHLQILINGPNEDEPRAGPSSLRRMRSSAAMLGGTTERKEATRDSGYAATENSIVTLEPNSGQARKHARKVRFSEHLGPTQETLVDLAEDIEAVADSLTAIRDHPLFLEVNRPETPIDKPEDTVDITYGQDGTPVAMSSTAIIEQLVRELNSPAPRNDSPSNNVIDIIFTTFRFFWEPPMFLQHLESAYDNSYYNDRKLNIVLLARIWVLAYWLPSDSQTKGLINNMHRFLGKAMVDGIVSTSIILDILARLEKYALDPERPAIVRQMQDMRYESMRFRFADITRDIPLIRGMYHNIRITAFSNSTGCLEFARQLTLKESRLYLQLTAREVISCFVTNTKDKTSIPVREKMKNVREFGCTVKRWAAFHVLNRSMPAERAKAFGFMMRLAKALLGIRNFSSAHSVFNGALSVHLDILYQTEDRISPKARRNMEYVAKFFEENKDISMQSSAEPTIPLMAIYAGKLSRLLESKGVMTPSKVDPSVQLINISFFKAATRITYAMESNQHPYDFKAHAPLQSFIDYTLNHVPDEDEIYGLYLKVKTEEQSGVPPPKPGLIRRLRTNSIATFQNSERHLVGRD